ncbi:hypothetical protein C8N40_109203 [Pontibacter mucosus]|uniref:Uncharacterized protein n=1 Tax=Pontibacter mucosus TaxID=1649266 RepID=A0A2T5YEK7_9BACT|nr:hypothetical protein C8N40_109203 [Pontibacter mucosus]
MPVRIYTYPLIYTYPKLYAYKPYFQKAFKAMHPLA